MGVSQQDNEGNTPLSEATDSDSHEIMRLLLSDKRVVANQPDSYHLTPLKIAFVGGNILTLKLLLGSGKELIGRRHGSNSSQGQGRLEEVEAFCLKEVPITLTTLALIISPPRELRVLMVRFRQDEKATVESLRDELNWIDYEASLYAQIIFLCDGLLAVRDLLPSSSREEYRAGRFFAVAARLPMDLQAVLANRTFHSMADHIKVSERERAFRDLVQFWSRREQK